MSKISNYFENQIVEENMGKYRKVGCNSNASSAYYGEDYFSVLLVALIQSTAMIGWPSSSSAPSSKQSSTSSPHHGSWHLTTTREAHGSLKQPRQPTRSGNSRLNHHHHPHIHHHNGPFIIVFVMVATS